MALLIKAAIETNMDKATHDKSAFFILETMRDKSWFLKVCHNNPPPITKNKSVLILTDSKEITDKLKLIFIIQNDILYYM